jgi:hypothetical protein
MDDEDNLYPPTPEADVDLSATASQHAAAGHELAIRVCGLTPDDPEVALSLAECRLRQLGVRLGRYHGEVVLLSELQG